MASNYNMIIEDYRKNKEIYSRLGETVQRELEKIAAEAGVHPLAVDHRVKGEKSLLGKLHKYSDWYRSLDEVTDLLGSRVICFFQDEIDIIGKKVEERFEIDWENSTDKRALIDVDKFGYLSLHYICRLRESDGFPPELCGRSFEIQIKSGLQHIWAMVSHDIDYKSEFGVPREIKRSFSRLAGLLEIADEEFVSLRDKMERYSAMTREMIEKNNVVGVDINLISLNEYVRLNREFARFMESLSEIGGCEVSVVSADTYIDRFAFLGITTLEQLIRALSENAPLTKRIARRELEEYDLDIISSNAAFRFLCSAIMVRGKFSAEKMTDYMMISARSRDHAQRQAAKLYGLAAELENERERYEKAYSYAEKMHGGQTRKGGEPYITHPEAVAKMLEEKGYGAEYLITALFHDLLEDTGASEEEILALGGERVLSAVRLLTKKKGYVMSEYMAGIRSDPIALAVKAADRLHNLRSAFAADDDFKRKYIAESREWYMELDKEIPAAVAELEKALNGGNG